MEWAEGPVRVRVPATSANLGPGFDTLGLALGLHDVVEARVTGSGLDIEVSGEGMEDLADVGEKHLIARAMRVAFDDLNLAQPPGHREPAAGHYVGYKRPLQGPEVSRVIGGTLRRRGRRGFL